MKVSNYPNCLFQIDGYVDSVALTSCREEKKIIFLGLLKLQVSVQINLFHVSTYCRVCSCHLHLVFMTLIVLKTFILGAYLHLSENKRKMIANIYYVEKETERQKSCWLQRDMK